MKSGREKSRQEGSLRYIAREVGVFGKDLVLDTAGELFDLGFGTLASLTTLGLHTPEPGQFNFRRNSRAKPGRRRLRR